MINKSKIILIHVSTLFLFQFDCISIYILFLQSTIESIFFLLFSIIYTLRKSVYSCMQHFPFLKQTHICKH
ncbi:hypothetical protein BJ944DRAFT_273610 [Cunninghamella echinulata]|nr:hypothetical protein BJ944DRAFT_273610 [Cunninghamella echinulata]